MFKPLLLTLLLLPSFLLSSPASAAEPERLATIALTARGTAVAVPDMANVSFTVEKRSNTAAAALRATSRVMSEAQAALAEIGVEGRDVRTSRFSVEPVVVYPDREGSSPPQDRVPTVVGYRVSNGIDVRLRDLDRLGTLLDRMVSLGINSIGGITFTNVDLDALREEARRDAVARALRRAQVLTGAAGAKLGRLLSIREGGSAAIPQRGVQARMQASEAVPIARGENEVSVTVSMEWEIEEAAPAQ